MNSNIISLNPESAEPQPFDFNGHQVRVVMINGEPHFIASDLCDVLEIRNSRDALARLDADEKGVATTDTLGGPQQVATVNESGMYSLVLTSRKPEAKAFKKWVTSEVLPAIRKTGSYGQPVAELSGPELMARALIEAQATLTAKDEQIKELAPKANAWDRLCGSGGDMSASEAAKALARADVPVGGLRKLYALCDTKRADGGLGWFFINGHGQREPYQRVVEQGLIRIKTGSYENGRTGELVATITPRFTAKALDAIARHFGVAA